MRVAILSDIHANLEAFDTVSDHARRLGADETWVLGDLVGYGADPMPVVEAVRNGGARVLCGNHDLAAIGRFDVAWFNEVAAEAIRWTSTVLEPHAFEYLGSLQPRFANGTLLVHGSVRDPVAEYVVDIVGAAASFGEEEFARCFFGHTHLPTIFALDARGRVTGGMLEAGDPVRLREGTRYLLNPGSVGQPRDHDPRASFLLYDDEADEIVLHRVEYPIERAQEKIVAAGLPPWLAERLAVGE
jgi:diadenosine tetraphosphatase ApaH/serine/threonine PP2A family protein phosphatase